MSLQKFIERNTLPVEGRGGLFEYTLSVSCLSTDADDTYIPGGKTLQLFYPVAI